MRPTFIDPGRWERLKAAARSVERATAKARFVELRAQLSQLTTCASCFCAERRTPIIAPKSPLSCSKCNSSHTWTALEPSELELIHQRRALVRAEQPRPGPLPEDPGVKAILRTLYRKQRARDARRKDETSCKPATPAHTSSPTWVSLKPTANATDTPQHP